MVSIQYTLHRMLCLSVHYIYIRGYCSLIIYSVKLNHEPVSGIGVLCRYRLSSVTEDLPLTTPVTRIFDPENMPKSILAGTK